MLDERIKNVLLKYPEKTMQLGAILILKEIHESIEIWHLPEDIEDVENEMNNLSDDKFEKEIINLLDNFIEEKI